MRKIVRPGGKYARGEAPPRVRSPEPRSMRKIVRLGEKYTRGETPPRVRSPESRPILYTTIQTRPHILERILDYLPQKHAYQFGISTRRLHGLIASLAHSKAYGTRDRNDPVPDPYFRKAVELFAGGDCWETKLHGRPAGRICQAALIPKARLRQCEGLPKFCPPKPYPGPDHETHDIHNPDLICEYDNLTNKAGFEDDDVAAVVNNFMGVCDECRDQELRKILAMLVANTRDEITYRCMCEAALSDNSIWRCYSCREWGSKGLTQEGDAYRQRLRHIYRDESGFTGARVYFDFNRPPHPEDYPMCRCGRFNPNCYFWTSIHMCTVCKTLMLDEEQLKRPNPLFLAELTHALDTTEPIPTTIIYE